MSNRPCRIVLAAGFGTRLGQTKALVDLNGQSALARIAALQFGGVVLDTIVVTGHDAEVVEAEAARLGLRVARNPEPARGQSSSLRAGLARVPDDADAILLHPVDLPLVNQDDYDACAAAWVKAPEGAVVVTSHAMRRGHPVIFGRDLLDDLLALGDDESARSVFRRFDDRFVHVEVDNPWVRRDIDTHEDLAAARAEF